MRRLLTAAALCLALGPAAAQQLPATISDHTVLGRVGSGSSSGPIQQIPFATLDAALAGVVPLSGPGSSTQNDLAIWNNGTGTLLADGGGATIGGNYTWSGTNTFSGPAALGTPASGTLTHTTGLPVAGITTTGHANYLLTDSGTVGQESIPSQQTFCLDGINFNSANTDNQIAISPPTTYYAVVGVYIYKASHTLTTATIGIFTTTGGGGTVVLADSAITLSVTTDNAAGNIVTYSPLISLNLTNLQIRIGTAEGAAATADVCIVIRPLF